MPADPIPATVEWRRGRVRLVDQRALPGRLRFLECGSVREVRDAITSLAVRGAPALGATGAFGVALAARTLPDRRAVLAAAARLRAARPTAVNLAWGVDRALAAYDEGGADAALAEARRIAADDVAANRALGALGAALLPDHARVLTHCNAGAARVRRLRNRARHRARPRRRRARRRRCGWGRPGPCCRAPG